MRLITIVLIVRTIGERLEVWRRKRGLSQRQAAELAGVTQPAWCNYERDQVVPRDLALVQRLVSLTSGSVTLDLVAQAQTADRARRLEDNKRRRTARTGTNG